MGTHTKWQSKCFGEFIKGMLTTTATFVKLFKKSQAFLSRPYRIPSIIRFILIVQVYCFTAANDFRGQLPEQRSILSGRWTLHLRNNMPLLQTITPTYFHSAQVERKCFTQFRNHSLKQTFSTLSLLDSQVSHLWTAVLLQFSIFSHIFIFLFFHT